MAAAAAKPPAKQRVVLMPLGGISNKLLPKAEFRRRQVLAEGLMDTDGLCSGCAVVVGNVGE